MLWTAVERELVLRLASLLWRLRRAAAIETGLFEVQAGRVDEFEKGRHPNEIGSDMLHAIFAVRSLVDVDCGLARADATPRGKPN
jgi:hypothetical protein